MKAVVYSRAGGPEVLQLAERPMPEPGPSEVRVKVKVSAVNPSDWKARQEGGPHRNTSFPEVVPNQDGAGIIDAVGSDIRGYEEGQRVWLLEAARQRPTGTAQEYVVLPANHVVPLPGRASFDLGATLGVPALTAHRALTVADQGPARLAPGALSGRAVLVAGGAGAVGHAAIELAQWAGAEVVTTVSSDEKAKLAGAAGAHHVVNYRTTNAANAIRKIFPDGVDVVVEVSPTANAEQNQAVLAPNGTIAMYANNGGDAMTVPLRPLLAANARLQFIWVYTIPKAAKTQAIEDVNAAVAAGALRVGEAAGLPLHRFPLERTADAHTAVESGVVGKVLIDVG
ncbi:NADPH:quinone reductase [Streptomyces chartreusis]|uniref:NADPH:quinone reductase n=1 Tax=Streptomyces chartreusis TaxID=1969 RepID=A0A7H8T073_STRCX|nr:NADPH:quinone reductase [Streptomyces chartreusis]QKZ16114.1 NADPH:quinone reductase [Streptomyces chartreusis]QKZ16903.1 NADPH:quinone reductase [Streptomyces chartreusis]